MPMLAPGAHRRHACREPLPLRKCMPRLLEQKRSRLQYCMQQGNVGGARHSMTLRSVVYHAVVLSAVFMLGRALPK